MDKGKITQPFYPTYRETALAFTYMTDEQAGQPAKAAANYFLFGEETTLADRKTAMLLQEWQRKIDESRGSYEKRVKANRQNGQKGGRPTKAAEESPEPF